MLALVKYFKRERRGDLALLTFLMFDTYLRVSEAVAIKISDVTLPSSVSPGGIRLPKAKTGVNQAVVLRCPHLLSMLTRYLSVTPASRNGSLFTVSTATYSREMARALSALQLSSFGFTPHSLRHGGASFDYQSGVLMQDIIARGRWRQPKSAQRYIQSGHSLLLASRLPESVRQVELEWQTNPERFLLGP